MTAATQKLRFWIDMALECVRRDHTPQLSPGDQKLIRYAQEDSHPVFVDREAVTQLGRRIVLANIMDEDPQTGYVRHNPQKLARVLLRWYSRAHS